MKIEDLPKTDKHTKFLRVAHGLALSFCGSGRNSFRLGSALVYKNKILAAKHNSGKTHPGLLRFSRYPFLHSESNTIISVGMDNCEDTSLYVVRILRDNSIALAKPCAACMALIQHVGISKIYFTTGYGYEFIRI